MRWRAFGYILLALAIVAALFAFIGWREARADPVVRTAALALADWPAGAPPIRALLLSDIHIGNAAMDEARLARIVAQANAIEPDLVLLAGDFIAGHQPGDAARVGASLSRILAGLHAPLGAVAVLGNHDHWTGASVVRAALERAHVTVLENAAIERGPLSIGGIGDAFTHHDRIAPTLTALHGLRGGRLLVTHSPDVAASLPGDATLVLAGHTHCGQIVLPILGALSVPSRYGERYRCGIVREGARTTIVTAGIGTSVVPIRIGAPPDMWLLTLGPAHSATWR